MDVVQYSDAAEWLARAGPLLLADEARHNLILGLAATLRDHPGVYPEHRSWLVLDGEDVVGAALRTPPHNLVLARPTDADALHALAAAIAEELPGVVGAIPEVERFGDSWRAKTGVRHNVRVAQRIYSLEHVIDPRSTTGSPRPARPEDRELVLAWFRAFAVETLGETDPDDESLQRNVDRRLRGEGAGLKLWDDDGPVSLAGFGGETPNGIRIGPVYTPPERRGRGYASALVASVSADLLSTGRSFCFLYTNLANPTSNKIYVDIGYEPVCDSLELEFLSSLRL